MRHDDGGYANARYDVLHAAPHARSDLPVTYLLKILLLRTNKEIGICRLEQQWTCAKWANILEDLTDHPGDLPGHTVRQNKQVQSRLCVPANSLCVTVMVWKLKRGA